MWFIEHIKMLCKAAQNKDHIATQPLLVMSVLYMDSYSLGAILSKLIKSSLGIPRRSSQ